MSHADEFSCNQPTTSVGFLFIKNQLLITFFNQLFNYSIIRFIFVELISNK